MQRNETGWELMSTNVNGIRKNLLAIPDPRRRAQELSRLVAEQQALLTDLGRPRRETIAELRAAGLTRAQIAEVHGVSQGESLSSNPCPPPHPRTPTVVVEQTLPTDPWTRPRRSPYLRETRAPG